MFRYILKRILIFLPTLLAISLLAFWLGKVAPGDPVVANIPEGESMVELTGEQYQEVYEQMGLDKPLFYLGLSTAAYPDTLFRIPGRYRQEALASLIAQYGNWPVIEEYSHRMIAFRKQINELSDNIDRNAKIDIRKAADQILEISEDKVIRSHLNKIDQVVLQGGDSLLQAEIGTQARELLASYDQVQQKTNLQRQYIPRFIWYGTDNQYHHWVVNFIKGDFGNSYRSRQAVLERIRTPIFWTFIINVIAILLVYILAVPLGMYSAVRNQTLGEKILAIGLFMLYSLPVFWIGTMLLVFFTNPEYGMDWFEGAGLGSLPSDAPFWDRFWETAAHLILPVFCMTYGSLAFMSRQMKGGMLEVLNQDYIRTARAKGLSQRKVIWRHAFRNALFPLITLFASVFPAAVTGSVVVEQIFNIPGMGREIVEAIFAKDWPVLYAILVLIAILGMIGNLVADILFAWVDPRIKFN